MKAAVGMRIDRSAALGRAVAMKSATGPRSTAPKGGAAKRMAKRNVVAADVWPFCATGSSNVVLDNGWNSCLACDEDWRP
jgi:hypothetical protein